MLFYIALLSNVKTQCKKQCQKSIGLVSSNVKNQHKMQSKEQWKKQFKEADVYRKVNPSSIKNNQSTTHPKAYYTSRLLNPFTKNLHSVEVTDFTLIFYFIFDLKNLLNLN